ncbi:unnamed protein product [Paramecium pentaurelia]|uniref:Guanylate-binding protein/Atlastin C-terminal domain-containing protein n=1 Tax=Paramecium pentaurelia TaxID=43138 RepID=A0A8S1S5D3_9CILI|nr:unnamed protein product [Paramecium pentaurelia]
MDIYQLLSFDGFNNTLEIILNKLACQKLQQIQNNLNIICIIGSQKSGKSWLLNKLFMQGQGFQSSTKGFYFTYDGQLIIDTEGLGCGDQRKDIQIILLASLLSSVVIYCGYSVEDFELLINLEDYEDFLPPFIWVLRDIQNKDALQPKELLERQFKSQNRVKKHLLKLFSDCVTIPSSSESIEFIDSMALLRRKVLNYAKPKKIYQNIYLNGPLLVDMIQMVVSKFNSNQTVDLRQITETIVDRQSTVLLNEAFKKYELSITQLKLPTCSFEELKNHHKDSELKALEYLKSKINDKDLNDDLHQMCKETFKEICKRNEQEATNLCNQFINQEFQTLQKRLTEYRSILEFERDIKLFYQFLLEHGPKTVLKQQVYQEFYNKMMTEGTNMFIKQQNQQQQQQQQQQPLQIKNENITTEKDKTINELICKVKEQENKIYSQQSQIKLLEEQLFSSDKQLEILQAELIKQKELHQQQFKQFERNLYLKESEFNKMKALNEQKIQHLSKQLEQSQRKETQMDSSFLSTKSEYTIQIRDVQSKYEQMITQLQERLLAQTDKTQQLQDQLNNLEQQNTQAQFKLQSKENKIYEYQQQIQLLKNSVVQLPQIDNSNNEENEKQIERLKEIIESQETQLKEKTSQLIQLKSSLEREQALIAQEKQFLEIQLKDLTEQLKLEKKNHEQTLSLFESQNDVNKSQVFSKQYMEMKDMHLNEMKQLEQEFEIQRRKMQQQIEYLNTELNKTESQLLYQQNDFTRELQQTKTQILNYEDNIQRLNREFQLLEQQKTRIQRELEEKLIVKTKNHQQEIEELKRQNINEYRLLQNKNEEQIAQLRLMYDQERQKIEQKFMEDRKTMEEKYNQMVEELENQYDNNQDEEIKKLQKKLKQNDIQLQQLSQHWQNENDLKQKQILSLEQVNNSLKISIQQFQDDQLNLQKQLQDLQQINQIKEEELNTLKQQGQYDSLNNNKQDQIEKIKQNNSQEKQKLTEQIIELKKQLEDSQDESIKMKVEYEKQLALITQENEFNLHKLEQLQNQLQSYESKNFTQLIKIESNVAQLTLETDLKEQQQKYEKLRQQYKEQEINNNKIVIDLQQQVEQLKTQLQEEQNNQQQKNTNLPVPQNIVSSNTQLNTQLKQQNENLQNELQELKSLHERDTLLWEGKFKFLQQQKDQSKQDLQEAMRKFEFTINHLQKARQQDLEEESNSISEMLVTLEKKYQLQVLDLTEHHQAIVNEYAMKIEQLQKELTLINMSNQNYHKGDFSDISSLYENQIEQIKLQYETKIEELYLNHTEERQIWRAKLSEAEEKLKDAEIRRSNMVFEHEKERAKWNIEKDELKYQKSDLQEQCQNLEQQKNKSDKKNKKVGTIRTRLSPNKSPGTFSNASKLGQSFDTFQQASMELPEENKSIHLNPGESFETYYLAQKKFD